MYLLKNLYHILTDKIFKLRASVENKEFIENPPTLEEGLELINGAKNNTIVPRNVGSKGSQYEPMYIILNKTIYSSIYNFKFWFINKTLIFFF